MNAKKIREIEIDGNKMEIIFSEITGRFACADHWEMTPSFFETEQMAIDNAKKSISESKK